MCLYIFKRKRKKNSKFFYWLFFCIFFFNSRTINSKNIEHKTKSCFWFLKHIKRHFTKVNHIFLCFHLSLSHHVQKRVMQKASKSLLWFYGKKTKQTEIFFPEKKMGNTLLDQDQSFAKKRTVSRWRTYQTSIWLAHCNPSPVQIAAAL